MEKKYDDSSLLVSSKYIKKANFECSTTIHIGQKNKKI